MLRSHHMVTLMQACEEYGYQIKVLDKFSEQLIEVSKNGQSFVFGSGNICAFPINNATSTFIAKDKTHALSVLHKNGFKVPQGQLFFISQNYKNQRPDGREVDDAISYAMQLGFPLFVKPNDGSRGAFVEQVFSVEDLKGYIASVNKQLHCIRLEKPLKGREYRLFIVDGKIWFGYHRSSPSIVCDGKKNVGELIDEKINAQQDAGIKSLHRDSPFILQQLKEQSLTLSDIPQAGVQLPFTPAQNIAIGGEVKEYTEEFSSEMHNFAKRLASALNLRLFGIDVYSQSPTLTPQGVAILEVNGNPSLASAELYSRSKIVSRLWRYVLEETFKQCLIK